jgi:hypothetical protein
MGGGSGWQAPAAGCLAGRPLRVQQKPGCVRGLMALPSQRQGGLCHGV